jgi:hypothetical protein
MLYIIQSQLYRNFWIFHHIQHQIQRIFFVGKVVVREIVNFDLN